MIYAKLLNIKNYNRCSQNIVTSNAIHNTNDSKMTPENLLNRRAASIASTTPCESLMYKS